MIITDFHCGDAGLGIDADLIKRDRKMGFFVGTETANGFEPSTLHNLLKPKISGNTINGVGEKKDRPATAVYHRLFKHPFRRTQIQFILKNIWDSVGNGSVNRSMKLKKYDKAAPVSQVIANKSPEEFTREFKELALSHQYVDVVGVCADHRNLYFSPDVEKVEHFYKHMLVFGYRMDYELLSANLEDEKWWKKLPWNRKWKRMSDAVMNNYWQTHEAAVELADWARSQGYKSEAIGGAMGSKVNLLRAAIESGLGELGKHGSILNDEFGSNLRFAAVLTDMPLVNDGVRDFGADEFCKSCRLCTTECPPQAISDEKKLVRGVTKWSVDFDKCLPYFNETKGCGICIAVCPWSRPKVAPNLTAKMLKKRQAAKAKSEKELANIDRQSSKN